MDFVGIVLIGAMFLAFLAIGKFANRKASQSREKQQALFVSMFPDLQPHYHPTKLVEFVTARRAKAPPRSGANWKNPAGFAADAAEMRYETDKGKDRETWRLKDAAGALLTQFVFEEHPEGGVLRVGKGKFTVNTRIKGQPKVRYWHPDREFKWTPLLWKFQTRMAEDAIDSSDRGTTWSSSDSSSSSTTARTAAATAGIVAAGGAFDGGGASQAWSDAAGSDAGGSDTSGSDSSGSDAAVATTSY